MGRVDGGVALVGEGGLVLGVVGDYNRSRQRDSVSAFSTTPARYTMTRRLRDVFSLRARAGVATGSTLIYGTGGVVRGSIRNSFTTSNTATATRRAGAMRWAAESNNGWEPISLSASSISTGA